MDESSTDQQRMGISPADMQEENSFNPQRVTPACSSLDINFAARTNPILFLPQNKSICSLSFIFFAAAQLVCRETQKNQTDEMWKSKMMEIRVFFFFFF
jgi:hypothetical protein